MRKSQIIRYLVKISAVHFLSYIDALKEMLLKKRALPLMFTLSSVNSQYPGATSVFETKRTFHDGLTDKSGVLVARPMTLRASFPQAEGI